MAELAVAVVGVGGETVAVAELAVAVVGVGGETVAVALVVAVAAAV